MGPTEEVRRAAAVEPVATRSGVAATLAWGAVWLLRIAAALLIAMPLFLLALWLAG